MKKFKSGGFSKSKGGFNGKSDFGRRNNDRIDKNDRNDRGGRGGERPELFKATCDKCHKSCEVPFRPSGDKPIYCRDCFVNKDDGGRGERDSAGKSHDTRVFNRDNRGERPPRKDAYPRRNERSDASSDDIKKKLETLEWKLNQVIELLNPPKQHIFKTILVENVVQEDDESAKTKEKTKKEKDTKTKKTDLKKIEKKDGKKKKQK